jgi:hypothetical protein
MKKILVLITPSATRWRQFFGATAQQPSPVLPTKFFSVFLTYRNSEQKTKAQFIFNPTRFWA